MNTIDKFLLSVALPVVFFSALIEALVLTRRGHYDWKSFGVSVLDLFGRVFVGLYIPLSLAAPLVDWAWAHRLTNMALDSWQSFLLLFAGQEFCYYWYHRAAHRVRWFWGNHAVHHSPNELNLAAAFRIGLLGKLTGVTLFFIPLIWLGFEPRVVLATLTLNLLYQFWIHATWIPRLGWLEHVLNTPSAHRVHHASNPEYLDANYGGVLIVFDRLFGTYVPEQDGIACRYGLVHPINSYNPLRIEFTQWVSLARDLAGARSLRAVLGYLLMPPGWKPDGSGQTSAHLQQRRKAAGASPHPNPPPAGEGA